MPGHHPTCTQRLNAIAGELGNGAAVQWFEHPPSRYAPPGWYWRPHDDVDWQYLGRNHILAGMHLYEIRERFGVEA